MSDKPNNPAANKIRAAFLRSGLSIKQLSILSGTPYASCHGFANGTRDIKLSTASSIIEVLGLELISKPKKGSANHGTVST